MAFLLKLLQTLPLILASGFGIIQAIIKFAKEVITLIINLFFPFFPDNGKFETTVLKVREWVNQLDALVEGWKNWLLKTEPA